MTEHPLDPDRPAELCSQVSGLPFPRKLLARPYISERRPQFGLDGFDVEGIDGRPIVRVEWDEPPGPGLRPIAAWAASVRLWLEAASRACLG